MFQNILGIVIAILALGVLVFVHELGHFIMAKVNRIAVDVFSVGFGRELVGFTIGETRYRIGTIPFGGYCKMRGEETKDRPGAAGDGRAMYNRPAWARLLAIIGGPLFNYLFAILLMSVLLLVGFRETLVSPRVVVVQNDADGRTTPAFQSGLRTGDTILSIDGKTVESFSEIQKLVALSVDKPLPLVYLRGSATNLTTVTPVYSKGSGMGMIGVTTIALTRIGVVNTNTPAARAGMKHGDEIRAVNGKQVGYFNEIQDLVRERAGQTVRLTVARSNQTLTVPVLLERFDGSGYLGVYPLEVPTYERVRRASGPLDAVVRGFQEANTFLFETLKGLAAMIRGRIDVQRNVSGPIRIVQITGEVATRTDAATLLRLLALISVALGFFNLLPFPGFDGGHIVMNGFELLTRRRVPEKVRTVIEYAGLVFIIGLSVLVFFNDIVNIILRR